MGDGLKWVHVRCGLGYAYPFGQVNTLNRRTPSAVIEINIPRDVQEALRAVDTQTLGPAIDECLDSRRMTATLRACQLGSCGPYVAAELRTFELALNQYAGAKAAKKLADTESRARRAGSNLVDAVRRMQDRVETEEKERQLFSVSDRIIPPSHVSERLEVRIGYRWRPAVEDEWTHGNITFTHVYDPRPDYSAPPPKRKPSASQQARDLQDALWREWEWLRDAALLSLIEYLREGRDGSAIPKTFEARVDAYDRRLNNFSCSFWLEPRTSDSEQSP